MATVSVTLPRGRASWSGLLQVSLVAVPVKAYPAVSNSESVHFNQLHAGCLQRINYQKRCPVHGPVDSASIVRGYQYAPSQYVVIEAGELEQLRPPKDRALLLEQFVETSQVDAVLYSGRTLYLLPDGLAAQRPYVVLAQAMRERGQSGLGRVALSGNRQLVLVRPAGRLLAMDVLHYPSLLRDRAGLEAQLGERPGNKEELRLAGQLIDSVSRPVDWPQYRDDTAEKIRGLVEAKIEGRPLPAPDKEPVEVLQLLDALRKSVAAVDRPPAKATKPRSVNKTGRRRSA